MTASNYVYLAAAFCVIVAWGIPAWAESDVTVISTASPTPEATQQTTAATDKPGVHKSLHKKKKAAAVAATPAPATTNAPAPGVTVEKPAQQPAPVTPPVVVSGHPQTPTGVTVTAHQSTAPATAIKPPPAVSPTSISVTRSVALTSPTPTIINTPAPSAGGTPLIETGLPVGRYTGVGAPIKGVSTYSPSSTPISPAKSVTGSTTRQPYFANTLSSSVIPLTSAAAGSFSNPSSTSSVSRTTTSSSDFVFTNLTKKSKNTYPWKTGIITTMFWIGEGGSTISATDNVASAWDENWRSTNRGSDNPYDRNGFATGGHASTVNPFYVALPFNDLAFADKARRYLPRGWARPPKDGKQVSACKDRWVWIKNANGRSCFAQWEDVGPLRYDHAEYVFGSERPDTYTRAGLDVSPAVAQYLGINEGKKAITSWRFVDDEDVPPGQWLKYDEQAVIYTALHQLKNSTPANDLPIQKAAQPIDDPDSINDNKKKIENSKG